MAEEERYLVYTVFYPRGAGALFPRNKFVAAGEPCFVAIHRHRPGFRPDCARHVNAGVRRARELAGRDLKFEVELTSLRALEEASAGRARPTKRGMTRAEAEAMRDHLIGAYGTLATATGPLLNSKSPGCADPRQKVLRVRRDEGARVAKYRETMRRRKLAGSVA